MSRYYNKDSLKESLDLEQIFDLLEVFGGEPEIFNNYIVSDTICHNPPGGGSRKLYYYNSTHLFHCYTGCVDNPSFDIFQLCIKVMKIQHNLDWELYEAMDYIAGYFGLEGVTITKKDLNELEDWRIFKRYKVPKIFSQIKNLKEYDKTILQRFSYPRIANWEKENILPEVIKRNYIGYYPGKDQITIPHFDVDDRLIGIRGRSLVKEEAEKYGKYRPLVVNNKMYNHPLSVNLYNLNNSKKNIEQTHVAIVFEGE